MEAPESKIELFRYKDIEQFKKVLSKGPEEGWIKSRNISGKDYKYIPISVKQALADRVFREWYVVDEKYLMVLNEIVCTIKIMALPDYPGADFVTFTGSASKAIQTDKGSKVHEFPMGKKSNALEYCLPGVRSEAIGSAFESMGNIFGRNLSRDVTNNFAFDLSYKKEG